jgi:xanthine dehydrogenase accessory factor
LNWLTALASLSSESKSHVLMTVLDTRGSSPRDVGTKMVVSKDEVFDTIGGGALEHQCIKTARELLSKNQLIQHTDTFNLGKDLKQCCGGVVSVFFEVFPASNFILNIFGAGHIGQALTKLLGDIDCTVNLFDSRDEFLQQEYPKNTHTHRLIEPEIAVETCSASSYFLVMTHDHALDQQLCESILARGDSTYCGVIGSRTKSIKFRQRLLKKGFLQEEFAQLTCPMGLSYLKTKKPMEIAISVVAELLILRDKQQQECSIIDTENKDNNIVLLENRD